ncbi:MAG TPA: hypothetical protein VNA89_08320, partial [Gemmatimonadaceae bacterium]|nr:hypothetical protein [Gemmatimonadaceae bacterium]
DQLSDERLAVRAVTAHGGATVAIVRAEVFVDGGPPPDGEGVRYFRLRRVPPGGGWEVLSGRPRAFEFYTTGW